jgi:hypothetical protein
VTVKLIKIGRNLLEILESALQIKHWKLIV